MPITNLKSGDLTSRKSVGNQRGVIWAHPGNRGVNGYGPPYTIIGRQVYDRVEAVRAWMLTRERDGERQPQAPRSRRSR